MDEIVLKGPDDTEITVEIGGLSESPYMVDSNKKKFSEIAAKHELMHADTLEMLLSLHVVLEVAMNRLFREIALARLKKNVSRADVIKNIDAVNFRDKLTLFIYNSTFEFNDIQVASSHHKIIGILKNFTGVRNLILHGHSIGTVYEGGAYIDTELRKKLTTDKVLKQQVSAYVQIVDGINFYINCLEDESLRGEIGHSLHQLNYDFIPKKLLSSENV